MTAHYFSGSAAAGTGTPRRQAEREGVSIVPASVVAVRKNSVLAFRSCVTAAPASVFRFLANILIRQWRLHCTLDWMHLRSRNHKIYKGLIAGAVGGLAASWLMTRFQLLLSRALGQTDPHEGQGEDATVKTARKISSAVLDHELSDEEKKTAGPLVHYAYGTGIGALYGGLAQKCEIAQLGFGSAYGTAAWALGDEIAVPALGLGKKPTETPASQQLQMLAAHVVYGATLEGVRRLALKAL